MTAWVCEIRGWVAWAIIGGLGLVPGLSTAARAGQTYLALGDSISFGVGSNDSATDISNGDRGYVAGYANYLASLAGGVRPTVINLAVSGETSSSFYGDGVGLDGSAASLRNTNYSAANPLSQDALMLATIKAQLALGNTISNVTISLGANDLFVALASGGSFPATLATFQTNEIQLLTQIRGLLPTTNLILLNYFDPYAPFLSDPTSPFYPIAVASHQAIPAINSLIAADAQAFGAGYADDNTLFVGKEIAETYVLKGNLHPTDAGYAMITTAVESVPEPSSLLLVGSGLTLMTIAGRQGRRRRRGEPRPNSL